MSRRRKAVLRKGSGRKAGAQRNRPSVSVRVKPSYSKTVKNKAILKRRKRNRLILIIAASVLICATALFFIFRSSVFESAPDNISVTVAWNPGSITDDMVRVMSAAVDTQITLQNITGANGANGANAVFQSERNGTYLLSTSLSALVTAEATGFSENSHNEWDAWLCAFSPAVIVVANDSPYSSVSDLLSAIIHNPGKLRCANSGFGTISFTAAEIFSTRVVLEFDHISFSGSSQAIEALKSSDLQEDEADFAILLSIEAAESLRTGQLRALGAFAEIEYILQNGDSTIHIYPFIGMEGRLDDVLPIGEYFGLFIPADTPQSQLHKLDTMIRTAVDSEVFENFLREKGLVKAIPDRSIDSTTIKNFSSIINWTLYDVGFLPTNPGTLGIPRP